MIHDSDVSDRQGHSLHQQTPRHASAEWIPKEEYSLAEEQNCAFCAGRHGRKERTPQIGLNDEADL